jgi:signal peptidase I
MGEANTLLGQQDTPFKIIRKPPHKILALRRIVYDNDHPAKDLMDRYPPRWAGEDGLYWVPDDDHGFKPSGRPGEHVEWLRYRHILREGPEPELITDIMGYNSKSPEGIHPVLPRNWVGDLILECEVAVDQPEGQLVLELSKGVDRFQARWDLASGQCSLVRLTDGKETALESKPTALKKKGTYKLRFANVDERLTVWVDGSLPFGDGVIYPPPSRRGPFRNDLEPASIGAKGSPLSVRHLKLWRDTYYTVSVNPPADARPVQDILASGGSDAEKERKSHQLFSSPEQWDELRNLPSTTMYVQPDHYLCLGDNSPESSDGRSWGMVPNRLLLGRALLVYWPIGRVGAIR